MRSERGRVLTYKWDNFQNNITDAFRNLQKDDSHLANVTLSAQGWCLKAHQFVLSSCSSYFREIFKGLSAWQHPVVVVKDISFADVQLLLKFVYNGSVDIQENQIQSFLEAGKSLQIDGIAGDTQLVQLGDDGNELDETAEENDDGDLSDLDMEEMVLESTRTYDDIEGLRYTQEQSRSFGAGVSNISLGTDGYRILDVSDKIQDDFEQIESRLSNSRRFSDNEDINVSKNKTGEVDGDRSRATCVVCEVSMTKKNMGRHMRNVHLLEQEQVSEILRNTFLRTPEKSLAISQAEPNINIEGPLDDSNATSHQENDLDETSILPGMETIMARHSRSIDSSLSSWNESRTSRKSKRKRKCEICGVKMSTGSMSRHLRNVHEIVPNLRSDPELSTSAQTSPNDSFLALGSKYRLVKPLESRRSLMSKYGKRSSASKAMHTDRSCPSVTETQKIHKSSGTKKSVHKKTAETEKPPIMSSDFNAETSLGQKRSREKVTEAEGQVTAESAEEPTVSEKSKRSKSRNQETNKDQIDEAGGLPDANDPIATDMYLNELVEVYNDLVNTEPANTEPANTEPDNTEPANTETDREIAAADDDGERGSNLVPATKKQMCKQCGMQVTKKNLQRHVRVRHSQPDSAPCQVGRKQENLTGRKQGNMSSL